MARRQLLAAIVVSGYLVAFVPVLWARYDISRIPGSIWRYAAPVPRQLWRAALLTGYLLGGWPGLVVAVVWLFSNDRASLREEWAHLHRRNLETRAHSAPTHPPEPEQEIVLADYEDEPVEQDEPPREQAPPAATE
jgi:hypothetical protein